MEGASDSSTAKARPENEHQSGLQDGPPVLRAHQDEEGNVKFYPPLYLQRYDKVKSILEDQRWCSNLKTVVDFGCGELAMFSRLKTTGNLTRICMVDVDRTLLELYCCRTAPLNCDYLKPRSTPLHVEVLCGSIEYQDKRTAGADAVICIELIEHLQQNLVQDLERTVFGFVQPQVAIFTTPNADFNVLFDLGDRFRHWDHKFEWTRAEFKDWTDKIITQYPYYDIEISGVGNPPEGLEELGFCSQIAVFIRKEHYVPFSHEDSREIYSVCCRYDFPVEVDERTEEEKFMHEVLYYLHQMSHYERYVSLDDDAAFIPLTDLTNAVKIKFPGTEVERVRTIVEKDVIERNNISVVRYRLSPSDTEDDFEDDLIGIEDIHDQEQVDQFQLEFEEDWNPGSPPLYMDEPLQIEGQPEDIVRTNLLWAEADNTINSLRESRRNFGRLNAFLDNPDLSDHSDDENDDYFQWKPKLTTDCEKSWNHMSIRPPPGVDYYYPFQNIKDEEKVFSMFDDADEEEPSSCHLPTYKSFPLEKKENMKSMESGVFASTSASPTDGESETVMKNRKREPITDSGVDLSPLLNQAPAIEDDLGDMLKNYQYKKTGEFPKSTSVEVLHLDGSAPNKRPAGLECVEFAPCTSVTLCYTGQTYDHCADSADVNVPIVADHKSVDAFVERDAADSCSLDIDRAGDSGYLNSSSLHQYLDLDLTPEQVDDISSENGERSNQSFSDDDPSDSSEGAPAIPRRLIHPRRPIFPMVFENVENGDLANNNRDGEGNNAVAVLDDEREFVALVQEGEMMLPLMAAPVVEDIVLPQNADPFPYWLVNLLGIEQINDQEDLRVSSIANLPKPPASEESDSDEGLGEDLNTSWGLEASGM